MTKLELKSSHEVIDTVNVADVESISYGKRIDPRLLTVLMKDGKRLFCDEVCPVQEEPVSDDLEEASDSYYDETWDEHGGRAMVVDGCHDIWFPSHATDDFFKAGAKWQKGKDESTTEDLGEYINELSKQFQEVSFAKLSRIAVRVAKWQKEQMMAKAIDGDITFDYDGDDDKTYGCIAHDSFCLEDFGLKDRDKVKVIVIKED